MTQKVPKTVINFNCELCNYNTVRKSQFERHLLTAKHQNNKNSYKKVPKSSACEYVCECGKQYKHRQNLFIHKKKCIYSDELTDKVKTEIDNFNDISLNNKQFNIVTHDTIIKLVNENNDIKNILLEQQKQIVEQQKQLGELIPKIGNTINNTANIKQKFNINIFLNEKCKDAINMNDFIQQMQLTLDNLDLTKNKGLTEGLSNIFIENINKLSLYERPLHCTDVKRDTLYIKENDNWEKDIDKTKLKDAIKDLNKNHFNLIKTWIDENPNFKEDDKKQDYFSNLLRTCGTNIDDVSDKVAKKICNLTHIKEHLKDLDENLIE